MDLWAPMFIVQLRISRDQMIDMSIPQLVDVADYWNETQREGQGG